MIMFPKTQVDKFRHMNKAITWAQAFCLQMKLDKVTNPQDKEFCDRLRNADEVKAKAMVASRTDKNN